MPTRDLNENPHVEQNAAKPVRDVMDFHLRWQEFRPIAQSVLAGQVLDRQQMDTVNWLIALADRVGQDDVNAG